ITTSPFMKELRSLTMKAANSASSSGRPSRPLETQNSCIQPALRQRLSEIGIKDSGSDGVDRDTEGGGFARETLRKANHGGLRGRVMNGGRQRANGADGGDVEDRAFALANHLLIDRFGHREKTVDVGVDDFIPRSIRGGRKVIAAIDRGIVDQDVNPAPFLNQLSR